LIELVQHGGPLGQSHPRLDPRDGGRGARQDRGMVGERYAERVGSRWDVPLGSPGRFDPWRSYRYSGLNRSQDMSIDGSEEEA